jgi:glycerol-3-phosphate O-acyltransferase
LARKTYPENPTTTKETTMIDDPKGSGARGQRRMREIASKYRSEIATNVEIVLGTLGRTPNALERIQAEALCGLLLHASRQRDIGKSDLETLREAAQLMKAVPWLHGYNARYVVPSPPIAPDA